MIPHSNLKSIVKIITFHERLLHGVFRCYYRNVMQIEHTMKLSAHLLKCSNETVRCHLNEEFNYACTRSNKQIHKAIQFKRKRDDRK